MAVDGALQCVHTGTAGVRPGWPPCIAQLWEDVWVPDTHAGRGLH